MADLGGNALKSLNSEQDEKAAKDTSQAVDEILHAAGLYTPLALLAITFFYTPELTKSAGVQCFHATTQDFTQMFYVNNYCWESLKHHSPGKAGGSNGSDGTPITSYASPITGDLQYHRAFTFALLACVLINFIPSMLWRIMNVEGTIKNQVDYIELGIKEGLQLLLRYMVSLRQAESESTEDESETATVRERLLPHIQAVKKSKDHFQDATLKFKLFEKYMVIQETHTALIKKYVLKRFISITLLLVVSWMMFRTYVENDDISFNCLVPLSPVGENDRVRANGVERLVRCGLRGIPVRILCVKAMVFGNILAIGYALVLWYKEGQSAHQATRDLRELCELSIPFEKVRAVDNHGSWYSILGYSDLDLLIDMTLRNLKREKEGLYRTCTFALQNSRTIAEEKKLVEDETKVAPTARDEHEMLTVPKKEKPKDIDYYKFLDSLVTQGLDTEEGAEEMANKNTAT